MIDSGAALNVVAEEFVIQNGLESSINRQEINQIRCANNSIVKSLGKIKMNVVMGHFIENMEFVVVPQIFPKIIIGLKQMKHSNICVVPKFDCIYVKNEKIPFVSKTSSLNCNSLKKVSENVLQPSERI